MVEGLDIISELNNIFDSDELIVNNNNDIDLNINYPYIIFNRDDLVRTINLCNKFILSKSDIPEYNSISFVPVIQNKTICMYTTNELSHFIFKTEMLGSLDNIIEKPFLISLNILQKIVKLMGNKVLIYNKDEKFYARLLDGDLLIDARPVNTDIIFMPGSIKDKICDINLNILGDTCVSILPLLSSEIRSDYKKAYFTGTKSYFKSPFYYIETNINTPKLVLSFRDIEFISRLYKYYKNSQIQLFSVDTSLSRIRLKLDNIEYQFINSRSSEINLDDIMNKIMKESEVSIQFDKLYRIINLATSLPNTDNIISIKYNNSELYLSIINNNGNSNFNFPINRIGNNKLYNKEIILNANTLKKLLISFSNSINIDLALNDNGITIKSGNTKAFLMNYN